MLEFATATPGRTLNCEKCGKKFVASGRRARRFCSTTCSRLVKFAMKHGESDTRLYRIWSGIKRRCHCKTARGYANYGARGIQMCNEWRESYVTFRDWAMAKGYQAHLEIDRQNTLLGYTPENCRWATGVQQAQNARKRRNAKTSEFKGVHWRPQSNQWIAQIQVAGVKIRIGQFANEIDAARAYDAEAIKKFGKFAHLNFPKNTKGVRVR